MKTVILAGGLGSRLAEETDLIPKPMVEVGGQPILWHIMRHYAHYGFKEFVLALGYKSMVVKRYFLELSQATSSITVEAGTGETLRHDDGAGFDWTVHLIDTGLETETGGRVRQVLPLIGEERFFMTYGDGVSDVDLASVLEFHRAHGKLVTMTVVRPPSHFGRMTFDGDRVVEFVEKPRRLDDWINGGFFVVEPGIADYLGTDGMWERVALERLADAGELMAYRHEGFWYCMDSLRDKRYLDDLWGRGAAPWRLDL